MVFAPHFDDETLGCGGTTLKKVRAGADVRLVFMTDGGDSHSSFMPREELSSVRRREGLAAAAALGVPDDRVVLLDLPDGRLRADDADGVRRAADLLQMHRPQQVFVPHRCDQKSDHVATHGIVTRALQRYASPVTLLEYPVWYWRHWPWTAGRHLPETAVRALRRGIGAARRLLRDCRYRVDITDVAAEKRAALDKHATQMSRFNGERNWPTLSDVWEGEFLACFFRSHEIFAGRADEPRTQRRVTARPHEVLG